MFGKKKKKVPKIEKAIEGSSEEEQVLDAENKTENEEQVSVDEADKTAIDDFLGVEENENENVEDDHLTEAQRKKIEKLNNVKNKISQILKSSNVEIVDENVGDEYDLDGDLTGEGRSQQDYDSLKAIFGDKEKGKSEELTLTIDDFDYTYVGQYLDEYDLMHMRNIKKIRMQRKYPKHFKKFLIAAAIVVVLGIGGILTYFLTKEDPIILTGVSLNQTENSYFMDEIFDYTGLYLVEKYSDGSTKRVQLKNDYLSKTLGTVYRVGDANKDIQFGSGSIATLTFSYQGFEVDYVVNILRKEEKGLEIIYADDLFNLAKDEYIYNDLIKVIVNYGDYGKQAVSLDDTNLLLYVNGNKCTYEVDKGFKVKTATNTNSVIKIVYLTKNIEIEYVENRNVVSTPLV